MKKIFLILLLGVSFSFAEINEYMSDVYFFNGIATDDDDYFSPLVGKWLTSFRDVCQCATHKNCSYFGRPNFRDSRINKNSLTFQLKRNILSSLLRD